MARPVRTCALSRQKADPDDLVRLVAAPDGTVVVDLKARLPGRGVWVTPSREVLRRLDKGAKGIERKLGVKVDPDAIRRGLSEALLRACLDGLSLARAGGVLVLGHDLVLNAVERLDAVVLASDVSNRTEQSVRAALPEELPVLALPVDGDALGARVGRGRVVVMGIVHARSTRTLVRRLRQLSDLG